MNKVNWLLVGTGDIAQKRVAPAIASTENSRLYAVCDLVVERARKFVSDYNVEKIYTDYNEAIKDENIDAVYIATPVNLHIPMALKSIKAGKHVLVEKPLGLSLEDTASAIEAERNTSLSTGCAYFRRFYPGFQIVKDMLENGEFGEIVLVRMAYFSNFDPSPDDPKYWRVVKSRSGGGPISDMGSHMFDVLIGLLGMPVAVQSMTSSVARNWDVEAGVAILMRLSNGAPVTASFNWNSKTWVHMFEIVGTEAKVLWQPYDSSTIIKTVGRDISNIELTIPENVHQPLIEDFVNSILEGRKPLVTFAEAAKTNKLMDTIYRAADEKREVII